MSEEEIDLLKKHQCSVVGCQESIKIRCLATTKAGQSVQADICEYHANKEVDVRHLKSSWRAEKS